MTKFRQEHYEATQMARGGSFKWPSDFEPDKSGEPKTACLVACLSMMKSIASGVVEIPVNVDLDPRMNQSEVSEAMIFQGNRAGQLGWVRLSGDTQDSWIRIHGHNYMPFCKMHSLQPQTKVSCRFHLNKSARTWKPYHTMPSSSCTDTKDKHPGLLQGEPLRQDIFQTNQMTFLLQMDHRNALVIVM